MLPVIVSTEDGSNTLLNNGLNETYHSVKGAIAESMHVFIKEGLRFMLGGKSTSDKKNIQILEVGFGTGLNAILTYIEAIKNKVLITYDAIEIFPLPVELVDKLSYQQIFNDEDANVFNHMHKSLWDSPVFITPDFTLNKINKSLLTFELAPKYDLIYFDAFGPDKQPEMWTEAILKKMFDALKPGGVFVTYSAKGEVKRNLREAGFKVSRLEGPPGKRHMVRGQKNEK